jgi:hypothetical protein
MQLSRNLSAVLSGHFICLDSLLTSLKDSSFLPVLSLVMQGEAEL